MDLIVTHTNADFDALGSLIAAKKLFPHSRLLLPGSPEPAVREFLSLFKDIIKVESENECDLKGIERLIVVDTRHMSRIGVAAKLIEEGIKPIIYDHHPRTEYDMDPSKDIYQELGATVTILLDSIKRRKIKLSPIEATILLLAIYEETGSLTFRTTTKRDVDAVSFLLSCGARLNMVSSYLNRELTEEQLAFLVRLIHSTHIVNINGVKVAICVCREKSYVGELGAVIHKLMDIENVKVVFVLLQVNSKVNIIARSHIQAVDVNKILKHFGGAGHTAAASGKVIGADPEELKEKLVKLLKRNVKIRLSAKDIMSGPFAIDVDTKIRDAKKLLSKNRLKGAPVLSKDGAVLGVINTRNINKAIRKKFGHARVKGYMFTKIEIVKPKTPFYAVQELISSSGTGILPVIARGRLSGVITRSDVLKVLHQGLIVDKRIKKGRHPILNLAKKMNNSLPKKIMDLLRLIGDMAQEKHYAAFVAGGFVRDIIMGVKNYDADVVVEGNAIEFSREFAAKVRGSLVIHKKFGTATVVMPWGLTGKDRFKVDMATARREKYERPAALPDVEFSSLRDDLYRRDFTINAMAVSINRKNFGQLIDFFEGQRHIESGVISVLHEGSFIDDPTRIFRAVRFEQRYGFRIDSPTEELIKTAIKKDMFGMTEKQRIREELILMLKEEDPMRAITRMHELDELRFIHPKIRHDKRSKELFKSISDACHWYKGSFLKKRAIDTWLIYLMALFEDLDTRSTRSICERFVFRRFDKIRILSYKGEGDKILRFLSGSLALSASKVYKKLRGLSYEVILLLMAKAKSDRSRKAIRDFLIKYNRTKISITGNDMKEIGYSPGPSMGRALEKILFAKIDGKIENKTEERKLAKSLIR